MAIDLITLEARRALDEMDTRAPHGESGGGITVGLEHIRTDDREAHHIVRSIPAGVRVIEMVAAQIIPRGGDAMAIGPEYLDDLIAHERIADAHCPRAAFGIDAVALDIAAGRYAEIGIAH